MSWQIFFRSLQQKKKKNPRKNRVKILSHTIFLFFIKWLARVTEICQWFSPLPSLVQLLFLIQFFERVSAGLSNLMPLNHHLLGALSVDAHPIPTVINLHLFQHCRQFELYSPMVHITSTHLCPGGWPLWQTCYRNWADISTPSSPMSWSTGVVNFVFIRM